MRKTTETSPKSESGTSVDPKSNANVHIAKKLKALYAEVEQEPIPDIFLDLLERLDKVEKT